MEFTINCTTVSLPRGTTLYGPPVEVSQALANLGPVSAHNTSSDESYDGSALNPSGRVDLERKESGTTNKNNLLTAKILPSLAHLIPGHFAFQVVLMNFPLMQNYKV